MYSRRDFFAEFGRSMVGNLAKTAASFRPSSEPRASASEPRAFASEPRASASEPQASACASPPGAGLSRRLKPAARLRPPGALPELAFLSTCTRCTDCQEACPYESIRRLGPEFEQAAGTPAIIPDESPCYLCEGMPCIAACEPMALRPVTRNKVTMGTAVVNIASCYVAQGQPCDYCVKRCPLGASAMTFGPDRLPRVDPEGCAGCGVCAYLCPASAIRVNRRFTATG